MAIAPFLVDASRTVRGVNLRAILGGRCIGAISGPELFVTGLYRGGRAREIVPETRRVTSARKL